MKPKLIVLKAGRKLPALEFVDGDYETWIGREMGLMDRAVKVVDIRGGDDLPPVEEAGPVVITGSTSMVTERAGWMVSTAAWLVETAARGAPILGICFGHQLLAQALGGTVADNPRGTEVGSIRVAVTEAGRRDPLFGSLPIRCFAQSTHRQVVTELPANARCLAHGAHTRVQAFGWRENVWGVQFHPEFNEVVVRHYVEARRGVLVREGKDPGRAFRRCVPSPAGRVLLRRFAALAGGSGCLER